MKKFLAILILSNCCFCSEGQQKTRVTVVLVDDTFDNVSLIKLNEAVKILDSVYNSKAFEEAVLAETFFVGNYGLTSAQLLELIRSGMNNYKNAPVDNSIDLKLSLYDEYKRGKEFGNTKMKSRITSTHRCFVLNNDIKCYISHLAHEYMHQIGFYDVKSRSGLKRTKTNSVPYKIGNIVSKIINNTSRCSFQSTTCKK